MCMCGYYLDEAYHDKEKACSCSGCGCSGGCCCGGCGKGEAGGGCDCKGNTPDQCNSND